MGQGVCDRHPARNACQKGVTGQVQPGQRALRFGKQVGISAIQFAERRNPFTFNCGRRDRGRMMAIYNTIMCKCNAKKRKEKNQKKINSILSHYVQKNIRALQ